VVEIPVPDGKCSLTIFRSRLSSQYKIDGFLVLVMQSEEISLLLSLMGKYYPTSGDLVVSFINN
jgi:hypothetical protein